jgi:hypothetical protein
MNREQVITMYILYRIFGDLHIVAQVMSKSRTIALRIVADERGIGRMNRRVSFDFRLSNPAWIGRVKQVLAA